MPERTYVCTWEILHLTTLRYRHDVKEEELQRTRRDTSEQQKTRRYCKNLDSIKSLDIAERERDMDVPGEVEVTLNLPH